MSEQLFLLAERAEAIAGEIRQESMRLAARGDCISVDDLATQLRPYADPDCRDCDGTGVWMGNVLVCNCILDNVPAGEQTP